MIALGIKPQRWKLPLTLLQTLKVVLRVVKRICID